MDTIYLGSHLSLSAPEFYLGTVKQAYAWGENTFMFYTGAPQNTRRLPTSSLRIEEGRAFLRQMGINESKIIVHAPYIINLANPLKEETRSLAKSFLIDELKRVHDFSLKNLVLHPGSSVGEAKEKGIRYVIDGLNEVFDVDDTDVTICLETMAGKGSEIGSSFEEIKAIIDGVKRKDRIGVCLDTCHINDAGYDVNDVDGTLDEFDHIIGLSALKVIHLNDSKNERGSHKDRHDNIGYGTIGFKTLENWVKNPRLIDLPKILETPTISEGKKTIYPYKEEIAMLRDNRFVPNWREHLE